MNSITALKHCTEEMRDIKVNLSIREFMNTALNDYFSALDGQNTINLYDMVLCEVEQPLLEAVLKHCGGNQSKASVMLGINRGTLRKKLKQYNLE